MPNPLLLLFLLLTSLLAGCVDDGDGLADGSEDAAVALPQLHGWVFDPAVAPIPHVELEASAGNVTRSVQTNLEGFYGFDGLPTGTPVLLTARAEGFISLSRQTTLEPGKQVLLNLTLEAKPVIQPYHDTVGPFQGFIQCQYAGGEGATECGPGTNENEWRITVGEDFAGGVIEIEWTENTAFSHTLRATVECATPAQCGDHIEPFAEAIGPSRLRVEIGSLIAATYFPSGGIMLMKVYVDPNNEANEASVGAAFAVSQEFEAIASMFYHAPPPPGFSVE